MDEPSVMGTENALLAAVRTPERPRHRQRRVRAACPGPRADAAEDGRGHPGDRLRCPHGLAVGPTSTVASTDQPRPHRDGSFMVLAGVTGGELRIEDVVEDDLRMIPPRLDRLGPRSRHRRRRRRRARGQDLVVAGDVGEHEDRARTARGRCSWSTHVDRGRPGHRSARVGVRSTSGCREPPDLHRESRASWAWTSRWRPAPRDRQLVRAGARRARGVARHPRGHGRCAHRGAVRRPAAARSAHPADRPRRRAHRRAPARPGRAHRARRIEPALAEGVARRADTLVARGEPADPIRHPGILPDETRERARIRSGAPVACSAGTGCGEITYARAGRRGGALASDTGARRRTGRWTTTVLSSALRSDMHGADRARWSPRAPRDGRAAASASLLPSRRFLDGVCARTAARRGAPAGRHRVIGVPSADGNAEVLDRAVPARWRRSGRAVPRRPRSTPRSTRLDQAGSTAPHASASMREPGHGDFVGMEREMSVLRIDDARTEPAAARRARVGRPRGASTRPGDAIRRRRRRTVKPRRAASAPEVAAAAGHRPRPRPDLGDYTGSGVEVYDPGLGTPLGGGGRNDDRSAASAAAARRGLRAAHRRPRSGATAPTAMPSSPSPCRASPRSPRAARPPRPGWTSTRPRSARPTGKLVLRGRGA